MGLLHRNSESIQLLAAYEARRIRDDFEEFGYDHAGWVTFSTSKNKVDGMSTKLQTEARRRLGEAFDPKLRGLIQEYPKRLLTAKPRSTLNGDAEPSGTRSRYLSPAALRSYLLFS
jgi:hypothetical protein